MKSWLHHWCINYINYPLRTLDWTNHVGQ